jgi:hypothetical protein
MNIPVCNKDNSNIKKIGQLFYDIYGNIYLLFESKYYILNIGRNNNLVFDEIDITLYVPDNNKITINKIKHTYDDKTLRSKVINSLDKETEDEDEREDNYFPESKFYYTEYDKNEDDNYGEDKFIISKFQDEIIKKLDYTCEVYSGYDTIIIDGTHGDFKNVVFSLENLNAQAYKITIYNTGQFTLNIVGEKRINYILAFNNDQVNFLFLFIN